jgi:hypothetical protein
MAVGGVLGTIGTIRIQSFTWLAEAHVMMEQVTRMIAEEEDLQNFAPGFSAIEMAPQGLYTSQSFQVLV